MPFVYNKGVTPTPKLTTTVTPTFSRAGDDVVQRDATEVTTNVRRIEGIKSGPLQFRSSSPYLLTPIVDNTLKTFAEWETTLTNWENTYPSDVSVDVYGTSVQARNLYCARIFDDGAKPIVAISLAIHGNETASYRGWEAAVDWLLTSTDSFATTVRATFTLYLFPAINPDGVVAATRNNANGVNLNRNWPYFWDSSTDADKGSSAASEPEVSNFISYWGSTNRKDRALVSMDIHDWSSKDEWGFLTEQIYNSHDVVLTQRSILNHSDWLMSEQGYTVVNPPVRLTEFRSKRKPYLYTWFVQNSNRSDCWGGIIEFPLAETNANNASIAQDICIGILAGAEHQLETPLDGTATFSENLTEAANILNTNPTLEDWSGSEPRPSFFSGNKFTFTQVADATLGRNIARLFRPTQQQMVEAKYRAGTAVRYDATTNYAEVWLFGGRDGSGTTNNTVQYHDQTDGGIDAASAYPVSLRDIGAAADATYVWTLGGTDGGGAYSSALYRISGTTSLSYSLIRNDMVFSNGIGRHTINDWNDYLVVAGGRDASGYLGYAFFIEKATGYQWKIGTFSPSRGWHSSHIYSDTLYIFGGFSGVTLRTDVDKLALTDTKISSATDGATTASTSTFTSSAVTFVLGNVGDIITIQSGSDKGEWTIAGFVDANEVTVTGSFTASATSLPFVLSTAPVAFTGTTAIPAARRLMAGAGKPGNALFYLHGGESDTVPTIENDLYEYDCSADTVSTLVYDLDEAEDEDTGLPVPIEDPVLSGAMGYFDDFSEEFVMFGGLDEAGNGRSEVYSYDVSRNLMTQWGIEYETYGWMRMNQAFTGYSPGDQFVVVAQVKNQTPFNPERNVYMRINVNVGPLSAIQRRVRTWYQVPATGEYETYIMPLELETGESEFRCYLRQYTAGTTVDCAYFAVYETPAQLYRYPLIDGSTNTAADVTQATLNPSLPVSAGGSNWGIRAEVVPFASTNTTVSSTDLLTFWNGAATKLYSLTFSSTSQGSTDYDALGEGTFTFTDHIGVSSSNQTSFEVNYNRSSGKELRYDNVSWWLRKVSGTITLKLCFYGRVLTFNVPNIPAESIVTVRGDNGIHTVPVNF